MWNPVTSLRRALAVVYFPAIWMILVLSARILCAQQQNAAASISGTVVDSRGLAVPNAAITAKNQATGAASRSMAGA